jgi:hypothetical protein
MRKTLVWPCFGIVIAAILLGGMGTVRAQIRREESVDGAAGRQDLLLSLRGLQDNLRTARAQMRNMNMEPTVERANPQAGRPTGEGANPQADRPTGEGARPQAGRPTGT